MEEESSFPRTILYCTRECRIEDLDPKYIKKEMRIFPCDSDKWEFEDVLLFLNSLRNYVLSDRSRYYQSKAVSYFTVKLHEAAKPENTVRFTYIFEKDVIEMKASNEWLQSAWFKQTRVRKTKMGTHNRILSHETERNTVVFS